MCSNVLTSFMFFMHGFVALFCGTRSEFAPTTSLLSVQVCFNKSNLTNSVVHTVAYSLRIGITI